MQTVFPAFPDDKCERNVNFEKRAENGGKEGVLPRRPDGKIPRCRPRAKGGSKQKKESLWQTKALFPLARSEGIGLVADPTGGLGEQIPIQLHKIIVGHAGEDKRIFCSLCSIQL